MAKERKSFSTCGNKGFQIQFPNKVVLSTQFGGGNYCENYDDPIEAHPNDKTSNNAEIAVFAGDGEWITKEIVEAATGEILNDDVMGRVRVEDWLKILKACENFHR